MKRLVRMNLFIFLSLFLIVNTTVVSANSTPPVIGINIYSDDCTWTEEMIFSGNYDILVRTEDFNAEDFTTMNDKYKTFYPFYEDIEYLQNMNQGWTSYSAYYKDPSSWGLSEYYCGMQFGNDTIVKHMEYIKLVYFDDEGNTVFISDEIKVPSVLFFQDRDAIISFNTTTNQIDPHLDPHIDGYLILAILLIGSVVFLSIAVEVIMAFIFKLNTSKAILNILFINLVTQAIMYVYFLMIFDGHQSEYQTHLYIYEGLVVIIEFGYLYWRLRPISWKRLALYVVLSNLISYLLGVIRHF